MSERRARALLLDIDALADAEFWQDAYRRTHLIRRMDSGYVRAVIRFLERAAAALDHQRSFSEFSGHWTPTEQGLPEPDDFPDLLSWLRATPLLLALYGQLAERGEPLAPSLPARTERYMTGTGQTLRGVHPASDCLAGGHPCPIHNPSVHQLRELPTHMGGDGPMLLRLCPDGLLHPDPDSLAYIRRCYGDAIALKLAQHRCDSCCAGELTRAFAETER
jgi:hypothetical protein